MLRIRDEQLAAFRSDAQRRFEAALAEHAAEHFPEAAAALGERLPEVAAHAVERAREYGFEGRREISKFLNLQLRFGRDFDRDPECAWAGAVLRSALPAAAKMERLYARALEHEAGANGYFTVAGAT